MKEIQVDGFLSQFHCTLLIYKSDVSDRNPIQISLSQGNFLAYLTDVGLTLGMNSETVYIFLALIPFECWPRSFLVQIDNLLIKAGEGD